MGKIPAGTHPNMAEEVIITDANGEHLELTEDGKLPVEMTVNIEATIEESQMHGTPDDGTNWVPLKVGADGTLQVQLKGGMMALDPVTGEPKPLSVLQDNMGNYVLRMVKASEVAYDSKLDAFKMQTIGFGRGKILKSYELPANQSGAYYGETSANWDTAEVLDISQLSRVGIMVKNNSTDTVARITQIVLTSHNAGAIGDSMSEGKLQARYNLPSTGVGLNAIPPGETKFMTMDELLQAGTRRGNDSLHDFVEKFPGGFAFNIVSSPTKDGTVEINIFGGV